MFQFFSFRSNEHVPHEQCMVGSRAHDPDVDPVALIPTSESIDDVNAISGVQVIDCSFSVDFPDLLHVRISNDVELDVVVVVVVTDG